MKKLFILLFALAVAVGVRAQGVQTMISADSLAANTACVNTGTATLNKSVAGEVNHVTVQVNITKLSGTVAGTLTLMGSVDGVNYKALTLADASTALHTFTATNVASQTFTWRLTGSATLYYRVSYTGTGTMAARMNAKIWARK